MQQRLPKCNLFRAWRRGCSRSARSVSWRSRRPATLCWNLLGHQRSCAVDLGLAGKKALVTGATKGIGRAIVELFLEEGASVALCARNAEEVDKAVAELRANGGTVFGATADAADSESLRAFIASA